VITQYLGSHSPDFEKYVTVLTPVLLYWLSLWFYISAPEQVKAEDRSEYQQAADEFLDRTIYFLNSEPFIDAMRCLSQVHPVVIKK